MCGKHAQRDRRYGDPTHIQPEAFRRTNNRHAQPRLGTLKQTTYKKLHGRHEHRVVMEIHLGRRLGRSEIVHHIDGNQHNNAIENLQIVTRQEHARIHQANGDLRRHG
jgi:hypothetical protein